MKWLWLNETPVKAFKVEVAVSQIDAVECDTCGHLVSRSSAQKLDGLWAGSTIYFCRDHRVVGAICYVMNHRSEREFYGRFQIDAQGIPVGYRPVPVKAAKR